MKELLKKFWNIIVRIALGTLKGIGQILKRTLFAVLYTILGSLHLIVQALNDILNEAIGKLLTTLGTNGTKQEERSSKD